MKYQAFLFSINIRIDRMRLKKYIYVLAGFIYVFWKYFYYFYYSWCLYLIKFSIIVKKYVCTFESSHSHVRMICDESKSPTSVSDAGPICRARVSIVWLCSELARIISDYSRAGFTCFNGSVRPCWYPKAIVGQPDSANNSRLRASTLRHARLLTLSPKSDEWYLDIARLSLRSHVHLHSITFYRRIPFATSRSRACLTNRKKHFSRLASFRFPKYSWLDLKQVLSDKIREFLCRIYIYMCDIYMCLPDSPHIVSFIYRILSVNLRATFVFSRTSSLDKFFYSRNKFLIDYSYSFLIYY